MRILDRSRPGVAAQGLGIAQGATDYALEYARTRETMGKPIAEHQLIAGKLADMETRCEAARGLLYRFGRMVDEGADDAELTKASAMAKLYCTDTAMEVTTEAVQILGGYGYIQRVPGRAHDARREDHADLRGDERDPAPRDRARDAEGVARLPPRRRRRSGGRAGPDLLQIGRLAAPAVDERVQAVVHELAQRARLPRVHEVRVRAVDWPPDASEKPSPPRVG